MTKSYDPHGEWQVPLPDMTKHVVITASYNGEQIPSSEFSAVIGMLFRERGVDGSVLMAYTQKYFVHPQSISLRDVWMQLSDEDRASLPHVLRNAILHMMTGISDGE